MPTFHSFWLWRTAQTWTSLPDDMAARLAALRFVWLKSLGIPLQPMIKLSLSTRYQSTSGVSSRNLTTWMIASFNALAWTKEKEDNKKKLVSNKDLSMNYLR